MGIRKIKNHIGRKIKNLRLEYGISQEKLAEGVNMSREHISCLENGRHMITIDSLYKIATYFKIELKEFF